MTKPESLSSKPPIINTGVKDVVDYFTPEQSPPAGAFLKMVDSTNSVPLLFQPIHIRAAIFQNRIWVSPMCQYSSKDGNLTDWHLVQLGGYATRGASLVIVEATAVTPEGRNTPEDAGLWKDDQIPSFKRVVDYIHSQGQKAGIQLQHAGRKASTVAPWLGDEMADLDSNGFPDEVLAPSEIQYNDKYPRPKEMTLSQIEAMIQSFSDAAVRCLKAGFDVIEIHGAHGYLIHQFLSPATNHRTDKYGGCFENRTRFSIEITRAIRKAIPKDMPLFFRISMTDWLEAGRGWEPEEAIELSKILHSEGCDLMDVTTAGLHEDQKIPVGPAFQAPFAKMIKDQVPGMLSASVGLIYNAQLASQVLEQGQSDAVLVAREFSRNPNFVLDVAKELGVQVKWPIQLHRSEPVYKSLNSKI